MGRLDDRDREKIVIEDNTKQTRVKGIGSRIERMATKADKKTDTVLVQYLTAKQQIIFKICKIVSGNLVVIENKVHELNPKKVWRYKKSIWYIIREIDRKPISNQDYDKVVARKDDTEADVPLIKAVLGAVQKQQQVESKTIWIIIAVIAIIGVIAFIVLTKGGGGASAVLNATAG